MALLAAALLHDTQEDPPATAEHISALFGQEVAELVLEVSDDKTLHWAERKRRQILHAPHISPRARQLKLADKICNVRDLTNLPPHDWSLARKREYLEWAAQVVAGLRGCNPRLEAYYDEVLDHAQTRLRIEAGEH
jgi:guanosine-3',5'-bis(diphosphate) 3'-pyrophosphohydrolase